MDIWQNVLVLFPRTHARLILRTDGSGFIRTPVVQRLLQRGHTVLNPPSPSAPSAPSA